MKKFIKIKSLEGDSEVLLNIDLIWKIEPCITVNTDAAIRQNPALQKEENYTILHFICTKDTYESRITFEEIQEML